MNGPGQVGEPGKTAGRSATVDLYWIPLGAGAHVVRVSGKLFEAGVALLERRRRFDLYHSALVISSPEGRFVIEQAPVPDRYGERRGVVAQGPVGVRWLGRFRIFRYEIRRWRDGEIPDLDQAVGGPVRLTEDAEVAKEILALLPSIPTPVWAVTSSRPVRCGTRTPWSRGPWPAPGPRWRRSTHPPTAVRLDGRQDWRWRREMASTTMAEVRALSRG